MLRAHMLAGSKVLCFLITDRYWRAVLSPFLSSKPAGCPLQKKKNSLSSLPPGHQVGVGSF